MSIQFPLSYKAIELSDYQSNIVRAMVSLRLIDKEIDQVPSAYLLVRVQAASCNPSDIAFLQGAYNVVKPTPCVPGFEGTGVVVATGSGIDESVWQGKRISFFVQSHQSGSWAEYCFVHPKEAILIDQSLTIEQAAGFFVNPFTAVGLFELSLKNQSDALILNAAGSRVSSYLLALAKQKGIDCFGIVRKEHTRDILQNKGFKDLFVTSDAEMEEKLTYSLKTYSSAIFLDAVAGEQTGAIARCMPEDAKIVVYGGLSGKEILGISTMQLIFKRLQISGFNLNEWLALASTEKIAETTRYLADLFKTGIFNAQVAEQVDLNDIAKGLRSYISSMSAGKLLIKY